MHDDIRVDSLNNKQTADLNRLKEWLYQRRITERHETERSERRQQIEEKVDRRKVEQPLFVCLFVPVSRANLT
ncbi:hypothetical protein ACFLXC_00750 [Chloroflexota bacterium]